MTTTRYKEHASPLDEFVAESFVIVRAPLLALPRLAAWAEACTDSRGNASVASHRAYLREVFSRSDVREALYLASPDLYHSFLTWSDSADEKHSSRIDSALTRYFARMCWRCTPFGLFAGVGLGSVDSKLSLMLDRVAPQRCVRLDMHLLSSLVGALLKTPEVRETTRFYPNSSLYRFGDRLRYAFRKDTDAGRVYETTSVEADEVLEKVIAFTSEMPRRFREIVKEIESADVSADESHDYVSELIDSQLLIAEVELGVTGEDQLSRLAAYLRHVSPQSPESQALIELDAKLRRMSASPIGSNFEDYGQIVKDLESLHREPARWVFQCDMLREASGTRITPEIIRECKSALSAVYHMRVYNDVRWRALADLIEQRYERQLVPLATLLDTETGIIDAWTSEERRELALAEYEQHDKLQARDTRLAALVMSCLNSGSAELILTDDDVAALAGGETKPLPDGFAVSATILNASAGSSDNKPRILFRAAVGPSGATMIGRFCHLSKDIERAVTTHLQHVDHGTPEILHAEIAHISSGRVGNIICRPVLRDFEIPYLATAAVSTEFQLPISDLYVGVLAGRVQLFSARHSRQVMPHLTTAHAYGGNGNSPLYSFLVGIQEQETSRSLYWSWGRLECLPRLPRLVYKRTILAPAQWRLDEDALRRLASAAQSRGPEALESWTNAAMICRWVTYSEGDNSLPVDLHNPFSVKAFIDVARKRNSVLLIEMLPAPTDAAATGHDGPSAHELLIPFYREQQRRTDKAAGVSARLVVRSDERRKAIGSEWMFLKLYAGMATVDRLIPLWYHDVVAPLRDGEHIDRAFFLRYQDAGGYHLRVRLRQTHLSSGPRVLGLASDFARRCMNTGLVRHAIFDTYVREIERYGGPDALDICEDIFSIDSEAIARLIALYPGDAGETVRQLALLRNFDSYLDAGGIDLPAKRTFATTVARRRESLPRSPSRGSLAKVFREQRRAFEGALQPLHEVPAALRTGAVVLAEREGRLRSRIQSLISRHEGNELWSPFQDILQSLMHVSANRLCRKEPNVQETAAYAYISRLYDSRLAREAANEAQEITSG